MKFSWSYLSEGQRLVLIGGVEAWSSLSDLAKANFYAITHALEATPLYNDGTTCLSEVLPGSAVMRDDGREMNVEWRAGTYEALKAVGFVYRVGAPWDHSGEAGLIRPPAGRGHGDIQGIHVLLENKDTTKGDLHIDYDWGIGHFGQRNDDVTQNYKKYISWYGEIPGME